MKKEHLPVKVCQVCQRPFSWRKKWEKNWDQVLYCSKRCRGSKHRVLRDDEPVLSGCIQSMK
ncbi:DUF2256 domain-containing protein [Oceanospirillum sediminis]|uniref:DUF2256 domain-containing protein n=1 Tax=Oceanospirillum sediminis TaxID=2760088 RepID=A0A839IUH5_9GAMM|nr:DUF2256 domain-containing protein [Oceanospirillum sediminis]MBB1488284.1 DUF2256 domain-containing protein [Oceanospirillum sediminis]